MFSIVKNVLMVGVITGILWGLGRLVDNIVPWHVITYMFALLRLLVKPIDFLWDTQTMFVLIGIRLFIETIIKSIEAFILIFKFSGFNKG